MVANGRECLSNGCRWLQTVANVLNVPNVLSILNVSKVRHVLNAPNVLMFQMFQKVTKFDVQTLLLLDKSQLFLVENYFFQPFLENEDFFVKPKFILNPLIFYFFLIQFISRVNRCYWE